MQIKNVYKFQERCQTVFFVIALLNLINVCNANHSIYTLIKLVVSKIVVGIQVIFFFSINLKILNF